MRNLRQIFVAFLLLFVATTAIAQSQSDNIDGNTTTAVRADVNGDGVVNEADIAEILAIMKNAGGVAEQPKYYWYVGQEAVTADNYTTLAESSSTKYTTKNYTTEKYGKVYILTPDIVTSIKIFSVNANVYVAESKYSQDTTFNVPGYKLWVTAAMGANAPEIYEYIY